MDLAGFERTLADPAPPDGLDPALRALWHQGAGDWTTGHDLINDLGEPDAMWVHAHLHRVEGDLGNAGYWYRRASKPVGAGELDAEWRAIAKALLAQAGSSR